MANLVVVDQSGNCRCRIFGVKFEPSSKDPEHTIRFWKFLDRGVRILIKDAGCA